MSKSAHAKGEVKVRKLPRCSKCKQEFTLVTARYGDKGRTELEWECPKCSKVVPFSRLEGEDISDFEYFLKRRCENGGKVVKEKRPPKRKKKSGNRKQSNKNNKRSEN
ncbi:MAG: hypothetical protein DRH90_13120 [Deltaproteobacteria bacterium]|nr:MAG: hypothetical protein DRH90_13120 [Deltaproteobacteria bacterium]RLC18202.1 MAG: hypothetical protein DRI24_03665 [Deltaproteobacteria bacterium]